MSADPSVRPETSHQNVVLSTGSEAAVGKPAGQPPPPSALPDVLVLGGGLAGSAAAIALARAGRSVTLVEREREPRHKVCGEFLSAEALHLLTHLGLDPAALGAVPIHAVRLCSGKHTIESALPFVARSLTRRCLDAALLKSAEAAGAQILRGITVESLTRDGGRWQAALSTGQALSAPRAILASGKHDLRGFARPDGRQGDLVAMKMYWQLSRGQAAALDGHVELALYPGGYAGLEPVEDGAANLSALVRRDLLASLGGGWQALLGHMLACCSHLRERLAGAAPLLQKPLAIASIPYGLVRSAPAGEQIFAVGDQAAVIPSFTGDGMSIALYSGLCAARALLHGHSADAFQRHLHNTLRWQVARATWLSRALLQPATKPMLIAAARLFPPNLAAIARLTRIPSAALQELSSV